MHPPASASVPSPAQPPTDPGTQPPSPATRDAGTGWGGTIGGAVIVFSLTFGAYAATLLAAGQTDSPPGAYFNHLARAFLDGRLHLADPPGQHDLTPFRDRWYVPFLPLPAVLMLPFVATMGLEVFSTAWFSVSVGAVNAALLWLLLAALRHRGWLLLDWSGRLRLALLFSLGTVHWQVATNGAVWFVSQTCTVMFILLALLSAAATPSPWPTSTALAIALWGRPNVLLTWPLLPGLARLHHGPHAWIGSGWRWSGWALRSAVPLAVSLAGLAVYNYARFENPFDFGYIRQKVDTSLLGDLHTYGQFSLHHVMRNLRVMLLGLPQWRAGESWPRPDDRGMSIFLTTPALLYLLRLRRSDTLVRCAALAVGLLLIPLLLYYNTGWRQFGYRFSLDFLPALFVLLAAAAGERVRWPLAGLILASIAVNAWGVVCWYGGWMAGYG